MSESNIEKTTYRWTWTRACIFTWAKRLRSKPELSGRYRWMRHLRFGDLNCILRYEGREGCQVQNALQSRYNSLSVLKLGLEESEKDFNFGDGHLVTRRKGHSADIPAWRFIFSRGYRPTTDARNSTPFTLFQCAREIYKGANRTLVP